MPLSANGLFPSTVKATTSLRHPYIVKGLLGPGCCDKVEIVRDDRW